jgi:hypothetical protein
MADQYTTSNARDRFAMALFTQELENLGHYPVLPSVPADVTFDAWVANESNDNLEAETDLSLPPV